MKTQIAIAIALVAGAAAAAPFEDSMAQRTLACTGCHGQEGRAAPDGYHPRLAGKPAAYLYNQLVNFRDNRRHYGLMTRLIDPLSDPYLMEIAQYFSALDLPYPPAAPAPVPAELLRRGETLVRQGDAAKKIPACVQCHGEALTGAMPATPGLLGLPRDYLNAQLGAWQSGQRRAQAPDCMQRVARALSPEDLTAVAAWLSSQPVPANTHAVATLARKPDIACGSAALPAGATP